MIPTEAIVYDSGVDLVLRYENGRHETIAEWDADTEEFVDHPWEEGGEIHRHMLERCLFEWNRQRGRVGALDD